MPPSVKITKERIVDAAMELVRQGGANSLNARALAELLGCSTQPIFSNFSSMEELDEAVTVAAHQLYLDFLHREMESGKYPQYKSFGMAYIRFADEEKELFKLLFMRDRHGEDLTPTADFESSVEIIMSSCGVTHDIATLIHMEMWACVHGIGTMLATSFLTLDWELISTMLSDVYLGIRTRHLSTKEE